MKEMTEQERLRYELTLEALKSVDEGRTFSHEEVLAWFEQRKREKRARLSRRT
jgi:predicted transcriptional regulator